MRFFITLLISLLSINAHASGGRDASGAEKIQHIIVIYLENHGFDNLYGTFPNAEGLEQAKNSPPQVDAQGNAYATLPAVMNTATKPVSVDARFPENLPNEPFAIDKYVPAAGNTSDLVHRFYQHKAQINHGKNDRFASISDAGGLTMGYYDGSKLPLWEYAKKYTLADHFFQSAYGGSFLNHMWLICACTPKYEHAPSSLRIKLDEHGNLTQDGAVTDDGYAVNTLLPASKPFPKGTKIYKRLPPQAMPTIGDRLSDKNISWAWFSGGWNDAISDNADPSFQYHHQPFVYFNHYGERSSGREQHLKDEKDFLKAIETGNLPAVSFYKPIGRLNEHPGYTNIMAGEKHIADLLARIEKSPDWHETAVIVTYDENGGFWDHVAPPEKDRWGLGSRVPTLIISPYAKKGFVDKTEYETTSILKFIENRFGLAPLTERDAKANDLSNAFTFK